MDNPVEGIPFREAMDWAPLGLLVVRGGRILWANSCLAGWLGCGREALVGLGGEEAGRLGLAGLFDGGEELLSYRAGLEIRLRRRRVPLPDGSEAHYFEDIGERSKLARERDHFRELAQALETKDAETGLLNCRAILQALENHASRSRRYGNPLSLIRLSVKSPLGKHDPGVLKGIAQELNAELRWADQIGRLDATSFLAILPETFLGDAEALAAKLGHDRLARAKAEGWTVAVSATAWRAGDDARKMLRRLAPKPASH
jgi:GGDEF domain-containing protein